MSEQTVLVIDDSATIRKLVDSQLSPAGYQVLLAASAEEGLQRAADVKPDLILLDHQLPGTTGFEVCQQLVASAELQRIPVVVSSTLRKKAYVEYAELDNVVDMLPKPYTEDLLLTTIANALDTAAMVVASQADGTAVPEVIHAAEDAQLAGTFQCFGLRELLDFLNNGRKQGTLEVESAGWRMRFSIKNGHIQAVTAAGLRAEAIAKVAASLPDALQSLAPVLKMTMTGRGCSQVDGFVQLLDRKVLDPRLMSKLLRYQAAMLTRMAFTEELKQFRFEASAAYHPLAEKLPLDISLTALLVEGAIHCLPESLPQSNPDTRYARQAIRGQNLDRAGLSARHLKVLNLLSEPRSIDSLAEALAWESGEVQRVLHGFELAELVERRAGTSQQEVVIFETDPNTALQIRSAIQNGGGNHRYRVVRDRLALQLVLKRNPINALVFTAGDQEACLAVRQLLAEGTQRNPVATIAVTDSNSEEPDAAAWQSVLGFVPHATLERPYSVEQLTRLLERIFEADEREETAGQANTTAAFNDVEASVPTQAVAATAVSGVVCND